MSNSIKIAILGYGHIGKKHAEIALHSNEYEIVALIDPKFSNESSFPILVPTFYTLQDFLTSGQTADIIAICTPNGLHYEQAKAIIRCGINVIIEKPVALKSAEASDLARLAKKYRVNVFPVMQNRFSPPAVWLKDLLNDKALGKIFMVQISCFWNRNEQYYTENSWRGTNVLDGGTLYTQFSHYLDIMYWLFGDITNIKSKFADFNHSHLTEFEDSGIITFDFEAGGIGSFIFSTSVWNENLESSLTIIAEKGSVKVGGQYMNQVEKCIIKDYTAPQLQETNVPNDYGNFKGSAQNHHYLYANIVDFLWHGKNIQTNMYDSVQVLKIIENIYDQTS